MKREVELYSEEEMNVVDQYIIDTFGKYEEVFHEIVSPDIHVDIVIIEPNEINDFYTLVTMGMGAHKMNVPKELAEYQLERAEMVICLPKDWNIKSNDEKDYWPLRWLKVMARLPINEDSWLGWGHTVPNGEPFADNTKLCCMLLTNEFCSIKESNNLDLPNKGKVNFYQMFPIYEEEMNYKIKHDAESLLNLFDEVSPVVDINRKNYCLNKKEEK